MAPLSVNFLFVRSFPESSAKSHAKALICWYFRCKRNSMQSIFFKEYQSYVVYYFVKTRMDPHHAFLFVYMAMQSIRQHESLSYPQHYGHVMVFFSFIERVASGPKGHKPQLHFSRFKGLVTKQAP